MLSFQDFFDACVGFWVTERTYHFVQHSEVERSHTEFRAKSLGAADKHQILGNSILTSGFGNIKIDVATALQDDKTMPGFSIAFDTISEKGEQVSMSLKALFAPDAYIVQSESNFDLPPLPLAAQVPLEPGGEVIQGFYLRDEGYSEAGAIAGRFTYQPTRQTLEMTTFYKRSVAVDQMRFLAPDTRLRTIVTYQRPAAGEIPTVIDLLGFGVEHKQKETK